MTDMIERIKIELEKRFTNAGFKPITITMKKSGDILKLSPYSESGKVKQQKKYTITTHCLTCMNKIYGRCVIITCRKLNTIKLQN